MIINCFVLDKKSSTEHVLECTPRLYTSKRWGKSFRVRLRSIQGYESVKRELVTHSSLFDREQEEAEEANWVCLLKIS